MIDGCPIVCEAFGKPWRGYDIFVGVILIGYRLDIWSYLLQDVLSCQRISRSIVDQRRLISVVTFKDRLVSIDRDSSLVGVDLTSI